MKIPENNIIIEKSFDFKESTFGIGNIGFVLNILRNKLYSSIIESLCREYSCNARDAHREIGTPLRQIEIQIPNSFDNNYIIRDFGIGISPQRMTEVFLQYGNSTKRDSNEFTGGWGIGSKLGFAYSEQFSIVTINKENDLNIKRTYIAFIDSSQCGKINLLKEEITDNHTGTEIIIPVEDKDIQSFIDGTLKSTQYWEIKPTILGVFPIPEYPDLVGSLLASGENWKIYANKNSDRYNNRSKSESLAIIDGIQYKINENFIEPDERWILSCNVHMFFDIGKLTLSASRETLQYDENTKKLINERIKYLQKELSEQIVDILDKKDSYIEAVEFYSFMSTHFYKVLKNEDLYWRGHKIIGPEVAISSTVLKNTGAEISSYFKLKNNGKISVRLLRDQKISINRNTQIYYNDLDPKHTYRNKNLKALESNSHIQIINYVKGKSYNDFIIHIRDEFDKNSKYYETHKYNYYAEKDNSFIFDVIKPIKLSSVIEDKTVPAVKIIKPKIIDEKISVYKLKNSHAWNLRDNFDVISIEKDQDGYYIETCFKKTSCTTKYKDAIWSFTAQELSELLKLIDNADVFSVKEKDITKFTKLKPLSSIIEEKFNEIINIDYYKSIALSKITGNYNDVYYNRYSFLNKLKDLLSYKNKIINQNSIILKYFEYIKYYESELVSLKFINKIEDYLNQKNNIDLYMKEAKNLLDKMKSRYKLLDNLNSDTDPSDIIDYINACDQQNIHKQFKIKLGKNNDSFDMDANGK